MRSVRCQGCLPASRRCAGGQSARLTVGSVLQLFTRLDVETGEVQSWCPGDRCFCEELIFVPGPNGDTQEDDGILLGMVFDGESIRSSLVVRSTALLPSCQISWCLYRDAYSICPLLGSQREEPRQTNELFKCIEKAVQMPALWGVGGLS